MKFSLSELNPSNISKIFKSLDEETKKVLSAHSEISIDEHTLVNICREAIIDSINMTDEDNISNFNKTYEKNLDSIIREYISTELKDTNRAIEIIEQFIQKNFINISITKKAVSKLTILFRFLGKYDYEHNIEVYTYLIKNNKLFNGALNLIFKSYKNRIISNRFDDLFDNDIVMLINIYCAINNIEINEDEEEVTEEESVYYNDDPVKAYLKEIGEIPRLSREEEQELAKKIKEANDIYEQALLTNDDTVIKQAKKQLDYYRNKFLEANLRLVVSNAKKYLNRGLSFLDLIQEGNLGLIKAIERYDYTLGFKFSTYATWWIRQTIARAIADQARTIRIPAHVHDAINRMNAIASRLTVELGHYPNDEELAKALGTKKAQILKLKKIGDDSVSLNMSVGEAEESELIDFIPSESKDVEDSVLENLGLENVKKAFIIASLTPKEEDIIIKRLGLNGDVPKSLESIAQEYNITRERIRQIEKKALIKLSKPSVTSFLKSNGETESNVNGIGRPIKSIYQLLIPNKRAAVDKYGIPKLSPNELQILIDYAGGTDFTKIAPKKHSEVEMHMLLTVLDKVKFYVREGLLNDDSVDKKTNRKTLFDALPYPLEDIETYALPFFTENDIDFLVKKSGCDDITTIMPSKGNLSETGKHVFDNITAKAQKRIKNKCTTPHRTRLSFIDLVGVKDKEGFTKLVLPLLNEYELELIFKKTGSKSLDTFISSNRMSAKEIVEFYKVVKKYRELAIQNNIEFNQEYKIKNSLLPIIDLINSNSKKNYTIDEVNSTIFSQLKKKEVDILIWYSGGHDFTKVDLSINISSYDLEKIYLIIQKINALLLAKDQPKIDSNNLEDILDYTIINELKKYMTDTEAIVLCLKAGFNNLHKSYSLEDIGKFLDINPDVIINIFDKSYSIYMKNKDSIIENLVGYKQNSFGKIVKLKSQD